MSERASGVMEHADMLYRAAIECNRQHTRYAKLVERSAPDDEQKTALEMAYLCDDVLGSAIMGYEKASAKAGAHSDEGWWHRGNMLWHASSQYIRRHANCDGIARRVGKQSRDRLAQLAVEFDLEASALLNLRMAAEAYRTARPEAE